MTNLLNNGSFENGGPNSGTSFDAPGWSNIVGSADSNRDAVGAGGPASDGSDWVWMGNSEVIEQTLAAPLTAGTQYNLTIDLEGQNSVPSTFYVLDQNNNILAQTEVAPTAANGAWVSTTLTFTPTTGVTSIRFQGGDQGSENLALDNAVLTEVCFTRDTMIDTDAGEVAVQDLTPGMMVRTRDNGFQPIRWVGMTPATDRAVRIKTGAMGNTRDLTVSPRHRMVLGGWQLEMLFDHDHALVTALELVNDDTIVRDPVADVEYYHIMFDAHEVIYAEGAATESFHPDQASIGSMDAAARAEIFALFPELKAGEARDQAAPSLSATQAAYVGANLDAFVN